MDNQKKTIYLTIIVGVILLFYSSLGFEEVNMPFMIIGTALAVYGFLMYTRINKNKRK